MTNQRYLPKISRLLPLFFLLLLLNFVDGQVRLSPPRNRSSSVFQRTTTSTPSISIKPPINTSTREIEKPTLSLQARTGEFFVHSFSIKDFRRSEDSNSVKSNNGVRDRYALRIVPNSLGPSKFEYTASIHGRPDLPSWLNLAGTPPFADGDTDQMENRAFLYGTPEKEDTVEDVMILARNLNTNEVLQKLIRIQIRNDKRYSSPVKQMAELWIENFDAWELLSSASANSHWSSDLSNVRGSNSTITTNDGTKVQQDENEGQEDTLLDELRFAISRTFRGRGVRPYIRDLKPATHVGARHPSTKGAKEGFVVFVGTATEFPIGLIHLARGLMTNKDQCNRTEIIVPDSYFSHVFRVNWCKFRLYNTSTTSSSSSSTSDATLLVDGQQIRGGIDGQRSLSSFDHAPNIADFETGQPVRHYEPVARQRDYSWEWVMVAVVPLAILLVLVLILSAVFFGCREGQHWRDYKTPRDQLNEYVNLRRTQHRLRLLSDQRQSIDILDATEEPLTSSSPLPPPPHIAAASLPPLPPSATSTSSHHHHRRPIAPASPTLSLGKQTVAQAAAVKGSNIELYKDTDSLDDGDERERLLAGHHSHAGTYPKAHAREHQEASGEQGRRRPSYDEHRMLITRDSSV